MMRKLSMLFIIFCFISLCAFSQERKMIATTQVNIDLNKQTGVIHPLQGGNLGPLSRKGAIDVTGYYKECKIPLVRLHDVSWYARRAVDISTIFKDFRDDPYKAENYDFKPTDDYIASILKTGAKIMFRLGESAEHTKHKYYIHPPDDFKKWAIICRHIIMHYNEGWANGFHYNIKYWEIWNEPDSPHNWTGTKEQYFKLYQITAKAIKGSFPDLKVGGPALTTIGNVKDGEFHIGEYVNDFLDYCKENSVPLDFFSWHNYNSNPWEIAQLARHAREILDQRGFAKTENILDEWNYVPPSGWAGRSQGMQRAKWNAEQSSLKSAAFVTNVLMLLQDQPVDMATLYTTTAGGIWGLFESLSGVPKKRAYSFLAFSDLVNYTPVRLETKYNKVDSLVILTGTNKEKTQLAILVSNFTSSPKKVNFRLNNNFLKGPVTYKAYVVDSTHNLTEVESRQLKGDDLISLVEKIKGPSVVLLKLFSNNYNGPQIPTKIEGGN